MRVHEAVCSRSEEQRLWMLFSKLNLAVTAGDRRLTSDGTSEQAVGISDMQRGARFVDTLCTVCKRRVPWLAANADLSGLKSRDQLASVHIWDRWNENSLKRHFNWRGVEEARMSQLSLKYPRRRRCSSTTATALECIRGGRWTWAGRPRTLSRMNAKLSVERTWNVLPRSGYDYNASS